MRTKLFVIFTLLALVLSACGSEAAPSMYIQPAGLTEEEEAIAKLLGADTDQHLFDVVLDGTARKACVSVYELVDGKWDIFSGGSMALDGNNTEGRLALGFKDLQGEYREALQFGKNFTAVTHSSSEEETEEGMSRTTAFLSNRAEVAYEKEIPIAVQIKTAKSTVSSYTPEFFFQPEIYEEHGYEHVYALTVTFSQEPLS